MVTLAWVLGLSLSISFLCSILEAVLLSINHSFVGMLRDQGRRAGDYLQAMQERIDEPISAILTLNTIAHTVGAAMGGALAHQQFGEEWIALFSAALTLAILIFSEIIPKTVGATFWKELAPPTAYFLRGLIIVMKPILIPLSLFSRMISPERAEARTLVSRAELEVLAEMGRRQGTLDEEEWRVVRNVMNLDDVTVGAVMTPRTDMVAVSVDASVEAAKGLMLDEGHLRLPVYERTVDRIVGVLLARDLWQADREGLEEIRHIIRPAPFAPATKPVEDLIVEMRRSRMKMAIVLDEFGGTAGLVTLEDLIEEIIGEIQDEHEDEPVPFQELEGGIVGIWGGVSLRDVNQRLDLDLPDDRHDTIGGYVFGSLNRLPVVGDEVATEGGQFRVVRMRGRRVSYLHFIPEVDPTRTPTERSADSSTRK